MTKKDNKVFFSPVRKTVQGFVARSQNRKGGFEVGAERARMRGVFAFGAVGLVHLKAPPDGGAVERTRD